MVVDLTRLFPGLSFILGSKRVCELNLFEETRPLKLQDRHEWLETSETAVLSSGASQPQDTCVP